MYAVINCCQRILIIKFTLYLHTSIILSVHRNSNEHDAIQADTFQPPCLCNVCWTGPVATASIYMQDLSQYALIESGVKSPHEDTHQGETVQMWRLRQMLHHKSVNEIASFGHPQKPNRTMNFDSQYNWCIDNPLVRPCESTFCLTKGGKLHYIIMLT